MQDFSLRYKEDKVFGFPGDSALANDAPASIVLSHDIRADPPVLSSVSWLVDGLV